jgi:hypothetical protein
MDDYETIPRQPTAGGGGQTVPLFLGLYLLVLAFFILLVSISTPESIKAKAVMDSLTSAFTTIIPPSTDLSVFTSNEGEILAGKSFQSQVNDVFATSLQVAKIKVVQPGRLMRVELTSTSLFLDDEATIRPGQYPLLDRLVATLSSRPTGMRYDMEFIIGSPYAVGKSLPIGQTLEMARAGAFVRDMLSRGAPADSVSIGIKPGEPEQIVIWFFVRFSDEERLRFDQPEETEAAVDET